MSQKFGIDVSHWQGDFNFARAKSNEGVEFAIIKAGGGDAGLIRIASLRPTIKSVKHVAFQKAHTSMEMQRVLQKRRKRQSILFQSLVERNMNTLSFMMLRVK